MKINKLIIFAVSVAILTGCNSSRYVMKERNNAKIDLVKEDFTISELLEGESFTVKVLGITCAKYMSAVSFPDTAKIDSEKTTAEMETAAEAAEAEEESPEDEFKTEIIFLDEIDSVYFTLSGDEFKHKVMKQKKAEVKKTKTPELKIKTQTTTGEKIKIKVDFFSVPVISSAVDTKAANYALYALMQENPDYEIVFYPQYEIEKSGFLFFYQKTRVKAKARLGKLTE